MPNIYLAGPMSGLPEHNYPAFNAAAAALRELGCFVGNPAEINPLHGTYRQCMSVDLAWILAQADMIVLLPGFEKSKGTRVEVDLALAIEVPIMLYDDALAYFGQPPEPTYPAEPAPEAEPSNAEYAGVED